MDNVRILNGYSKNQQKELEDADKDKFKGSKKYYVHLFKGDRSSYLNITSNGVMELSNNIDSSSWKTKFTRDEVIAIDPNFVPFMEEVEDDE